jgi:threonine aldolase
MSKGPRLDFTSDNISGASAPILEALARANEGTAPAYGTDSHTAELERRLAQIFERPVAALPVATGTAANALALASIARAFEGIYCHGEAHVMTDECGAPEFYTGGAKLLGLASPDGRLLPDQLAAAVRHARSMGVHHVQPAAVSVSQATEWGTVYSLEALGALAQQAHALGLKVHMDGARFANALARLGCTPAQASWRAGIDILSLGATKNGALAAEVIVAFDPAAGAELASRRKRAGHLWSKMRFLSAQLEAYLSDGLWLANARQANDMARRLAAGLSALAGVRLVQPVEANEIFAVLPKAMIARLREKGYGFYDWPAPQGESEDCVRVVASFDMRDSDVDAFIAAAGSGG